MKTPAKILAGLLLGATVLAAVPVLAQTTTPAPPQPQTENAAPPDAGPGGPPPDDMANADEGWGWWGHRKGGHGGRGDCGGGGKQARGDGEGRGWWGHGGGRGDKAERGPMRMMRIIDTNSDGVIGDDEAASRVEGVFYAMDADSSGDVTEAEFMAVRMGRGEGRNPERMAQMQERKKARFPEMDANKDGKVSKEEFLAAGKARFAAADTDKDGKVTPWEFRAQRMN
jgi:EF hand